MKLVLAFTVAFALPTLAETAADRFAPKRGFSTDIRVQWQNTHDMVTTLGFLDIYPDYPRHMPAGTFARLHAQGFDTVRIAADPSSLLALAGTAREEDLLTNLPQRVLEAAPKLPLVLSGACWGGSKGLSVPDPSALHDANVIWSFHTYDPFEFSHQGASWTGSPLMFIRGLSYPPAMMTDQRQDQVVADALARAKAATGPVAEAATRAALRQIVVDYRTAPPDAISVPMDEAVAWADAHQIPHSRLFLGEFGALWFDDAGQEHDPASHMRFLTAKRSAAEAVGIGWAVWSFSGNFAITDSAARLCPGICHALGLPAC